MVIIDRTKLKMFSCNICGFPKYIPEAPNSKIGEILLGGKTDIEMLKLHFLKHHPKEYKGLLDEIKQIIKEDDLLNTKEKDLFGE